MKTLFRLFVLVVVALAAAAAYVRDSAHWTAYAVAAALDAKDVEAVEAYVDLERFVASSAAVTGAATKGALGINGTDAGSQLLGGLVDVVASGVGVAVAKDGARELRTAIKEGRLERRIGPFELAAGRDAIGPVTSTTLTLNGSCHGKPASLTLLLEARSDGPLGGRPRRHVVVGIEEASATALARACQQKGPGR